MNIDLLQNPAVGKYQPCCGEPVPSVILLLLREKLIAGSVVPDSFFSG